MKKIVYPDSIIFLGASNSIQTMGTGQLLSMLISEYNGEIYPVHPNENEVLGMKAYKSITDVPITPDLAVITLPTEMVPEILQQCGEKGIKRAIITSGGFEEIGNEKMAEELESVAEKYGIRYLGPNCIGVTNAYNGMNTTWEPNLPRKGGISVLSQSGTFASLVFPYMRKVGAGLSKTVSVGNTDNISFSESLEYMAEDDETEVILFYLEGLSEGSAFYETAKEISKPMVAWFVGGSEAGSKAAASHTASVGGSGLWD